MHLVLDKKQEVHTQGHVALVSNMPHLGPHVRLNDAVLFNDGLMMPAML